MKMIQENQKSKQWPQFVAVLTASITAFCLGTQFAWPSPSTPKLISNSSSYNITSEEASYIAMIGPLGDAIGAPIAAALADVIGRKNGILLISVPLFISWLIIAFAESAIEFCVGRFIGGIGNGMAFITYPMYVGEITEPKIRGVLGSTLVLGILIGVLAVNVYGSYLSIRDSALVSAAFPVLGLVLFFWQPESPYYLIIKGKLREAKKALYSLRRCDVENDFQILIRDVHRQMSERGTLRDLFCIKSNQRALLIMLGIRTMHMASGMSAWALFTQTIFIKAGGDISPVLATIIYLCTQVVVAACGSVLVDKYGRKPVLLTSCLLTGVTLLVGGAYFYVKDMTDYDTSAVSWFPLVVMIIFVIVFSLGLNLVPNLMLGELFSASIKAKALFIMCVYSSVMVSLTSKLFYFLTDTYGIYSSYFTFGTLTIISFILGIHFVPETKKRTLEEIQQYFKGNTQTQDELSVLKTFS